MGFAPDRFLKIYVSRTLAITFFLFQPAELEAQSSGRCTTSAEIIAGVDHQAVGCSRAGIVQQLFLEENASFGFFLKDPEMEAFAAIKSFVLYDRNIGLDMAVDSKTEEMRDGILAYVPKVELYGPKTRSLLYQMYLVTSYYQLKNGSLSMEEMSSKIKLEKLPMMRQYSEVFDSYRI